MSGTNRTVVSSVVGKGGSSSEVTSALSNANTKAIEILGGKKKEVVKKK